MQVRSYILIFVLIFCLAVPVFAEDDSGQLNTAEILYSKSVDLANAGNYRDALEAADQALALNVTPTASTIPRLQANRAGILVMLGRYEEAIAAADVAIAYTGNIPTTKSIAWYNKGDALRHLGRISEAREAYETAHNLDSSLPVPDMTYTVTISETATATVPVPSVTEPRPSLQSPATTPKAPLPTIIGITGLIAALLCRRRCI